MLKIRSGGQSRFGWRLCLPELLAVFSAMPGAGGGKKLARTSCAPLAIWDDWQRGERLLLGKPDIPAACQLGPGLTLFRPTDVGETEWLGLQRAHSDTLRIT